MGTVSAGRAIAAGFRLVGREPLSFLVWMAAYLLVGVLPQIGAFALVAPAWSRMMRELTATADAGGAMPSAEMMRMQLQMMQAQPIAWLAGVVSHTLVLSAIYRAVLFPEERRFFYLRLGKRELWLGLVMLVLAVMLFLAFLALMLPLAVIGGIVAAVSPDSRMVGAVIALMVLMGLGVGLWAALRLSMATPMSFAENGFRLYESWGVTRGHAGKMFLVGLALAVIIWIAELVVAGGAIGAVGTAGFEHLGDWFRHPHFDLASATPWIVAGCVAAAFLSTAFFTLFGAAWAEIYRELSGKTQPAV
ncbi:hypothetical protein [Phenylobacterium sp.]|jgi:hypothetical protein|uniref:hypothetical protein n=1 Tax=Phenylobacterium sp. TaxID=1871053 RepID=UPI002F3FCCFB